MQIAYLVAYLYVMKENRQGNENLPPPASPSDAQADYCAMLYLDRRPAQLTAGD
jgi:hypothetical protein